MPELRSLSRRWRHVAGVGLVVAGLGVAPAAVSADVGPHGGGPVAYGGQEQGQWQGPGQSGDHGGSPGQGGGPGQGWGNGQGGSGQGWGDGNSGSTQGPPSGGSPQSGHDQGAPGDQGQAGASAGWGGSSQDQGGWGGSGQAQASTPATPQVATPSATVASSVTGNGNDHGSSGGWGGGGHSSSGGSSGWGSRHGWGAGSGSGWGSHGNGHQSGASTATATPSVSTATKTTPATETPATSSATGSSAPAAPSASTTPAASAPVPVSVNPTQPSAPSSPSATSTPSTPTPRHGSAPAGKSRQRPSSRHAAAGRRHSSGRTARRAPASALLGLSKVASGAPNGPRAFTATAGHRSAGATAAAPARQHHQAAESPVLKPLNTLGHELSAVPALVGGLVPLPVPDWSKPIIAALMAVCLLLALRALLISHRAHRLESQRRQLTADLAAIQTALIPDIPPALGGLDVSVAYRPADGPGAGGDFYDVFALGGDRVAIIVGDVSGHGRDALGRAAHMHYTLRAYVEMGLEPRAALKLAGRVLGADEDDLFTTVAVAVHDADAATLTYATAGHPPPVLAGPGAHEPLTRSASPALGWGAPTGRRQTIVSFPQGARACFFTDGVTEARVGDELLGRERLTEIVRDAEPGLAAPKLLEHVQQQTNGINDDMAACIIEATTGSVLCDRRVEELEVDLQQIAAGQAERFLAACGVEAADADSVIAEARETAAEQGAGVLRVEMEAGEAFPSVTGPAVGRPELQQA